MLMYNNEAELASIIRWVYLDAINYYRIEREEKSGVGYVDFIFYPFKKDDDAIIICLSMRKELPVAGSVAELKVSSILMM